MSKSKLQFRLKTKREEVDPHAHWSEEDKRRYEMLEKLPWEQTRRMAYLPLIMEGICVRYTNNVIDRLRKAKWPETKKHNRALQMLIKLYETQDVFQIETQDYLNIKQAVNDFMNQEATDEVIYRNGFNFAINEFNPGLGSTERDVVEHIQVATHIASMCLRYELEMQVFVNKNCNIFTRDVRNIREDLWKVKLREVLLNLSYVICGKTEFDSKYSKDSYVIFQKRLNAIPFEAYNHDLSQKVELSK